jgi:hypothetical protein
MKQAIEYVLGLSVLLLMIGYLLLWNFVGCIK